MTAQDRALEVAESSSHLRGGVLPAVLIQELGDQLGLCGEIQVFWKRVRAYQQVPIFALENHPADDRHALRAGRA